MHPLQQRVGQIRQWWNRRALVEVCCWILATAIAIVLALGLVDYLVRATDRGLRVLLSVALVLAIGAAAVRLMRWWRKQTWNEMGAAQALQRAFPALGDRLASSLEFLRQEEDDPTAGSAPLRRAVVSEATSELETMPAEQVAQRRGTNRAVAVAIGALLVAGIVAVAAPQSTLTATQRLLGPWNNVEWPRQNDLAFVDPPALLARGDAFEVSLVDEGNSLPADVAIEYRYQVDGRRRTEQTWMQRVGNTMVARRENVRRSFEFRATGGDHHSMQWNKVEVVDRPTLGQLVVTVHPPAYSGLDSGVASANTRLLSGSSIELTASASEALSKVELQLEDEEPLTVEIAGDDAADVHLPNGNWTPRAESGTRPLRGVLKLVAKSGLSGEVTLPPLEVVADQPPEVAWQQPSEDLFVVPTAQVPVAAQVSDDLSIARIELTATAAMTGDEAPPEPWETPLFDPKAQPPQRDALAADGQPLDRQTTEYTLEVAPLELAPGTVLELTVRATDFAGQSGSTPTPRRLSIITAAELDSRLAGDQAEILRLLEQALADERLARQQASDVAASDPASRPALDGLLNTRLTQQGVRRTLTEKSAGVVDRCDALIDRLAMNRVSHPELVTQLQRIIDVVSTLGKGPLPAAEQQLTELRKTVESLANRAVSANEEQQLTSEFNSLDATQQEIIAALEQLIDEANAWSDTDRFIRELARLEQEERELRERSLELLRRSFESRTNRDVAPPDQQEIDRLTAAQADLARRFDKMTQAMNEMAGSESVTSDLAARLQDAVQAAESANLSAQLADASRELNQEQFGRAAETQESAADALRELVDRLRDRAPTDPGELASRLRDLQRQLNELAQQANDAAEQANEAQQNQQRDELAKKLEQLSRELNRLTAQAASQSAQSASANSAPKPGESKQQSKQDMEQAKKDIEQAQRELAQRIAELEGERQQRLLERLAQVLDDLIPRQQVALEDTLKLDGARDTSGALDQQQVEQAGKLATTETQIAHELEDAMADVEKRAVFQLALGGAAGDMRQAASALESAETGRVTQNLELNALARMRHVLDILRDPPPPPPEDDQSSEGGGSGGGEQPPQQPPLIELAEVKMLRWLQVELNSRTRQFEADLADNPNTAAEKREAARRLADEQQRLEELVREMMRRNNRNMQRPVDL
ncbi:hypothetical protein NG895_28410 [Aeoliella sp. ICT_H6.2]|uniref:Uncharacterized protein n=1 Tax=Aeoliella straminimaris TaxID=2954799 RepID=A0A9X2JJP7_9BACT|nr:hypothetical protein [Aeoliella straminimaris]MCO6047847.1 hypothetical protein [Aeoliella straminimaris]